jgi:hypothetical protein
MPLKSVPSNAQSLASLAVRSELCVKTNFCEQEGILSRKARQGPQGSQRVLSRHRPSWRYNLIGANHLIQIDSRN